MKRKFYFVAVLLGLEVFSLWVLVRLPNTLVSVINVTKPSHFNAPPGSDMAADIAGQKFYYRIPSPYLERFRQELAADVTGGDGWEKVLAVARWARTKLRDHQPASPRKEYFSRDWSPIDILDSKTTYRGLCDSYVKLFTIGCLSLEIPARAVWLSTHSVAEVFWGKRWVMVDPAYGFYAMVDGSPASALAIRKSFQDGPTGAVWEPVVFDISEGDHSYRPGMEQNFRDDFLGFIQVADANYSLNPPGWSNYFQIYQAINWVDEGAGPQGIWERRLRWFVVINFLVLLTLFVFIKSTTWNKQ